MAIKTNLVVDQGTNFIYNIYLIDEDGNIFDISDYTANAQIRKTYTSTSNVAITTNITGASGLISLTMNAATTSLLTQTRYVYDLELTDGTNVSRILEGFVTVNPGVTR
jgi:hypothetical protein